MTGPATLEHLRSMVIAGVRKVGRGFTRPDDDWVSMVFMQTPSGVEQLALPTSLFTTGASKNALAAFLRGYVVSKGVFRYALLVNAHAHNAMTEEQQEAVEQERLRVEQVEGAQEVLYLVLGDAEDEEAWMAPILRKPKTAIRTIGTFDKMDAHDGRFAGLNTAIRWRP